MAIANKNLTVGAYYYVRVDRKDNEAHSDIQVARFDGDDNWTFGEQTKERRWDVLSVETAVE